MTRTVSSAAPTTAPAELVKPSAVDWQKRVNIALILKITALVVAIFAVAFTAMAAILLLNASVVIGLSIASGVMLLSVLAAVIAQQVLLKKMKGAEEKSLEEEELQQALLQSETEIDAIEEIEIEALKEATKEEAKPVEKKEITTNAVQGSEEESKISIEFIEPENKTS